MVRLMLHSARPARLISCRTRRVSDPRRRRRVEQSSNV